MLPRKHRITRKEFEALLRPNFQIHGKHLRVAIYKKPEGIFQASVVVSKKVAKKATERNLISRRLYNITAKYPKIAAWPVMLGIFAKTGIGELSFKELTTETREVLNQVSQKLSL